MQKRNLLIALAVVFLSVQFVLAFTASISNPRMVLYQNITQGEKLVFENSVTVNNDNPNDVQITIQPTGDWKTRVNVAESNFTLKADERKEVVYTISIEESGYYGGDILATFSDGNSNNTLSAAQEIEVFAIDKATGRVLERKTSNAITGNATLSLLGMNSMTVVAIILAVILVIILIIYFMKRGKKNEQP